MNNLSAKFENYLLNRKVGAKTLRNYRCDINHFFGWAITHLSNQGIRLEASEDLLIYFSNLPSSYKAYLLENQISQATTNRRLSTLRNFSRFLVDDGFITTNPAQNISNVGSRKNCTKNTDLLSAFSKHLSLDGVSKITSKNYVSDVRHFLAWLERASVENANG